MKVQVQDVNFRVLLNNGLVVTIVQIARTGGHMTVRTALGCEFDSKKIVEILH